MTENEIGLGKVFINSFSEFKFSDSLLSFSLQTSVSIAACTITSWCTCSTCFRTSEGRDITCHVQHSESECSLIAYGLSQRRKNPQGPPSS